MKINRRAIFLLSIFACQSLRAASPEHSVSPSRQFIIYGANASLRGAVSQVAEQTKTNLLAILRQPDRWKTPIVVNLQSPQANLPEIPPAEMRFSQTGFGLKLQLDLTIAQNADASLVERELLRAILLEMIYRRELDIAPGTVYVEPPDWLLDGVLALTRGRDPRQLVEALAASGKIMPLEEFLQQRPALLDSPGRLPYRAYSFAFVQLLVDGMDGPAQLARYIDNLSRASNDPLADLKAQFPLLRGDLKETWRSTVTRLSTTQEYQLLTFAETDHRLSELLRLKIDNQVGAIDPFDFRSGQALNRPLTLNDLLERKMSLAETAAVHRLSQDFLLLATRANPVMRPIVREYQQIAALLASGKRRKLPERLARLKTTRSRLAARMSDIDDYMNWFEATQSKAKSEVFADYLRAASEPQTAPSRRRDALSVYLDSLEGHL
jgi:hypothetical protein